MKKNKTNKTKKSKLKLTFGKIDLQILAKFVVLSHQQQNVEISQRKLQRIVYCIQGEHLANFGKPLFDEQARAWANGAGYKEIISFPIDEPVDEKIALPTTLNTEQKAFLICVIDYFTQKSEKTLILFGYKEQAWNETRKELNLELSILAHSDGVISIKSIKKSFRNKNKRTKWNQ
jgi:uncharacterized phage-associated protein